MKPVVRVLKPKTAEGRKLQEDDVCKRTKESYPEVDANKFRAISISTALASEAVEKQDDKKFQDSNLDKLIKILGDKVSDNAIARKQENPRRLLNSFVDSIVEDLKNFETDVKNIFAQVEKYKADMNRIAALIVSSVAGGVRAEVTEKAAAWNRQVKNGATIDKETIDNEVSKIVEAKLDEEINAQMRRVIEDFQSTEMKTVKANISATTLEKKTAQIEYTYTTTHTRRRDARGFWENVQSFFGKTFTEEYERTRTEIQTIDLGTTFNEFLDSLMPQVEKYAKAETDKNLENLRDNYFARREESARNMQSEIEKLRGELLKLKF